MKYNYNLFNKKSISRIYHKQKNKEIISPFKRSFRNRINKINRCRRVKSFTTTKRFNY